MTGNVCVAPSAFLTSVACMCGRPQTAYIDALTDVEVKTMGHHKVATVAGKEDAANKQVHTHVASRGAIVCTL